MTENQTSKRSQLSPIAQWVLAGVAFGLAYIAASRAIDTGSLIEYTAALILIALGIRNMIQAIRSSKA